MKSGRHDDEPSIEVESSSASASLPNILAFPQRRIYRIPINSPHDCNDQASPPPFRDENCKCTSDKA